MQYSKLMLTAVLGVFGAQMAGATPTPEEAAQLGKSLTPVGAIKAGNKEGTIPEWTGGVCTPPPGYKPTKGDVGGAPYVDPFAADKPLLKITAANVAQYADKIDVGTKELLQRFPKTFYMNVYPTRRSACYPNWVYENTIKRVMNPKIVGGSVPALSGAHAQVPFPIPKTGVEVMWNKLTGYDRALNASSYKTLYVDASGNRSLIDADFDITDFPYWDNNKTSVPDERPYHVISTNKQYPPSQANVGMLIYDFLRPDMKGQPVWSYIPGQRRVRLAPEFAYDGVAPSAGGTFLYDEGSGFMGKMDKYDFNLQGRKEIYIPYNSSEEKLNYREEVATPGHLDPAAVRWELHRVWVVEATLKAGERHVQKKKVFYLDEDSWLINIYVGLDHADKPHHLYHFHVGQMYDRPGQATHAYNGYDLSKGAYTHWMMSGPVGGITAYGSYGLKSVPASQFLPEGMTGRGMR